MSDEILFILAGAGFVILAMGIAMVVSARKTKQLQTQLETMEKIVNQQQEGIRALFSGAAGVGGHLSQIEQLMRRISERQDQLDLKDSSNHSYDHAIRLIQSGADYEEIIARCGLVKEEADLLVQMYRYDKAS